MPQSAANTLTVNKESATVVYTGDTTFAGTGSPQNRMLSAQVTQSADGFPGDITKAVVRFTLTRVDGGQTLTFTLTANAAGVASTKVSLINYGYDITVGIDSSNGRYTGGPVTAVLQGTPMIGRSNSTNQYNDLTPYGASITGNKNDTGSF